MHILLQTKRLILRRVTTQDADAFFALDNDPEVMRYLNGGLPTPRDAFDQDIFPGLLQYDAALPGFGFWSAQLQKDGQWIGWFSLRPAGDSPTVAALGYRLRRAVWGRGLATEGVRALIGKGFTDLGMRRVVATTYEKNLASRRVMEKAGMRLVRRFRLTPEDLADIDTFHTEGTEVWDGDDVEYALDKTAWARGIDA